jgi:hypothetical protein
MKTNYKARHRVAVSLLLSFSVMALVDGCNYNNLVGPQPPISLKLGYFGMVAEQTWTFVPFSNQHQISFDSLQAHTQNSLVKGLMVRIDEYGVKCKAIGFRAGSANDAKVMDSVEYVFQTATSEDREIFVTGKNGWKSGFGGGSDENNDYCAIDVDYLMPIKLFKQNSNMRKGVFNNDTLEISSADTIRISYRSLYTTQSISCNLIVK